MGVAERVRQGVRDTQTDIDLLFHLFMHSLVASYMCPEWKLYIPITLVYQADALTN